MPLCLSFVYLRPGARLNYKTEGNLASREAGIPRALPGALPAALSEIARLSAVSLIRPHSRSFFSAIFDFLNKKRIICFFVPFHAHFSTRGRQA